MALFKILRGSSSKISTSTTPFHDGYAYFTVDDGGFYIDATDSGTNKRIMVNPKSVAISCTLLASGWVNGAQTVTVTGLGPNSDGVVGVAQGLTEEQRDAVCDAGMYVSKQTANALTVAISGSTPVANIPIVVTMLP